MIPAMRLNNPLAERSTMHRLRFILPLLAFLGIASGVAWADQGPADLVREARISFQRFLADPDMAWARKHLSEARAVVIVPSFLRAGFIIGGAGGRGVMLYRDPKTGAWSGPAFYAVGAGSLGFQIGADASEVLLMVMSDKTARDLMTTNISLGGDASVAAGPVGAGTGREFTADVASYARSKGLYAGLSLQGAVLKPTSGWNERFYGKPVSIEDILVKHAVDKPLGRQLRSTVEAAVAGR